MFCRNCGHQLNDRDTFCPKCGRKINVNRGQQPQARPNQPTRQSQGSDNMFCKNCGHQLNDRAMFCPKCGSKVNANKGRQPQVRQSQPTGQSRSFYDKLKQLNDKLSLKIIIPVTAAALFIAAGFIFLSDNDDRITQANSSSVSSSSSRGDSRNSSDGNSKNSASKTAAPKSEETAARVTEAVTQAYDDVSETVTFTETDVTTERVTEPPVKEETYKGSSGNTFTIPPEGYAQVLIDGTKSTVPATYKNYESQSKYNNFDKHLTVYLDGNSSDSTSKQYVVYSINTTVKDWSTGSRLYLDDMSSDTNYISVKGYYTQKMTYTTGNTINFMTSQHNKSLFEESELTVIDLNGSELKFYFNLKISPKGETHTFEGVGHVILDADKNSNSGSSGGSDSSGGNSDSFIFDMPTPSIGGTEKCWACMGTAKCRVCDGTGKVWGRKQKVRCTNCRGTGVCPSCTGGYVTY